MATKKTYKPVFSVPTKTAGQAAAAAGAPTANKIKSVVNKPAIPMKGAPGIPTVPSTPMSGQLGQRIEDVLNKEPVLPVAKPTQTISTPTGKRIVPTNDRQRYKEFTTTGTAQAIKDNAGARAFHGFYEGLSPVSLREGLAERYGQDTVDTLQGSKAYLGGQMAGVMAQFAIPYAGAAPKIGKALSNIPKYANAGKIGQTVARSAATDLAVGVPLNVNYAFNKEGLRGEEALKSIGINTAIDLVAGGVLEVIGGVLLRSGKKVASKAEFDALPAAEKVEAAEQAAKYYSPRLKKSNPYMQQIYDTMNGKMPSHKAIVVGDTPQILQDHGAGALQLTMPQSAVRKIAYPKGYMGGQHNLGFYALEQMPEQLSNPVAILKSASQKDSVVVLTELLDPVNRPVIIPIHLNKKGIMGITNDIPSMYGRTGFDSFIEQQRKLGNILYENKEGLQKLPVNGLQLPEMAAKADPIYNMHQSGKNYNTFPKKVIENARRDQNIVIPKPKGTSKQTYKTVSSAQPDPQTKETVPKKKKIVPTNHPTGGNADTLKDKINYMPKKGKRITWEGLQTQIADDLAPLRIAEEKVRGKLPSAEKSLYKTARLNKGVPERANLIIEKELKPIVKGIEEKGYSYKDLGAYAEAVHARDVNNANMVSGFSNAEIADAIKRYSNADMESARKALVAYSNKRLDDMVDAGILAQDQVNAMRKKWQNYMPLNRYFDDEKVEFANGISKALTTGTPPVHKLKGSEQPLVKAFTVNEQSGGRSMDFLYSEVDRLTIVKNSNPEAFKKAQYDYINGIKKEVSEIQKEIRTVQNSEKLTPEQKRTKLNALYDKRNDLAYNGVKKYKEKYKTVPTKK